ncbi:protein of unknown function DUF1568 [Desulfatibacillum aliphaticivorans]|uniref:Transposase IS200-like domain-containing protein n=1 Tax=Desulfatibacillum aliphaticivorans TaxID=218208 RepID=B8FI84_DESAL|nr:transposase [Desulfatibacillum aliphaticivorans]ACL02651.1 protein of unknown function DUF1568 [Desulfatibacillum aliphaticivorans]
MAPNESRRRIHDEKLYGHFISFTCYRRRLLLRDKRARGIVIYYLAEQLKNRNAECMGFVVMLDHVHALVRFDEPGQLSIFMSQWKRRSSLGLKKLYRETFTENELRIDLDKPMWQPRYHSFEIYSKSKAIEKIKYMHRNPVKAGLVKRPEDWLHSSARWYTDKKPVGVSLTKAF